MLNWWLPTLINQFTSLPLGFLSPNMRDIACPLGPSLDKYLSRSYPVCLASVKGLELQGWTNYMRFMPLWNWNTSGSESCRGKSHRSKAMYVPACGDFLVPSVSETNDLAQFHCVLAPTLERLGSKGAVPFWSTTHGSAFSCPRCLGCWGSCLWTLHMASGPRVASLLF